MEARKAGLLPFQVGTGGQAPPENAGAGGEAVCRGGDNHSLLTPSFPSRLGWGQARQTPAHSSFPTSKAKETRQGDDQGSANRGSCLRLDRSSAEPGACCVEDAEGFFRVFHSSAET